MNTMQYKGYHGSVEISPEDNVLYRKLLFVSPLVTYEGTTAQELEKAFIDAVDDYLVPYSLKAVIKNKKTESLLKLVS